MGHSGGLFRLHSLRMSLPVLTGSERDVCSCRFRPNDVLWHRSHDTSVLLHCVLWPMVSLLLGTLIVLLTVCARSLAVRAEALQKRKCSYEVCQDLSATPSSRRGNKAEDPHSTNSDPEASSPTRTLPLFAVPVRRRDREH